MNNLLFITEDIAVNQVAFSKLAFFWLMPISNYLPIIYDMIVVTCDSSSIGLSLRCIQRQGLSDWWHHCSLRHCSWRSSGSSKSSVASILTSVHVQQRVASLHQLHQVRRHLAIGRTGGCRVQLLNIGTGGRGGCNGLPATMKRN